MKTNRTAEIETFTVQPHNLWFTRTFAVLADAIAFGLSCKEPFGVSARSGAMVWVWEMRP